MSATASDYGSALALADGAIDTLGCKYVAVAVGSDVVVFADSGNDNTADDAVVLKGATLADISGANIIAQASQSLTTPHYSLPVAPIEPGAPTFAITGAHGTAVGNMDTANLSDLLSAVLTKASATELAASGAQGLGFDITGSGFSYSNDALVGGSADHLTLTDVANGATILQLGLTLPHVDVSSFQGWLAYNQTLPAFSSILNGADQLTGGPAADVIDGYAGRDLIAGGGGADSLYGGAGDDVIYAGAAGSPASTAATGPTWLRGEDGDDYIVGGAGFDNINGNQGADTVDGGSGGGDWLLGGQGGDLIVAHGGDNILNGNLGNDSLLGGAGHDSLRGGQGDDMIWAGPGGDWISGDLGADTSVAGAGADTFYLSTGAGQDVVFNFDPEHDHVEVAAGLTCHVAQLGDDTVVDLGQGDFMTLVGVSSSRLSPGWLIAA